MRLAFLSCRLPTFPPIPCAVYFLGLVAVLSTGCGLFSYQRDAFGLWQEAIEASRINQWSAPTGPDGAPPKKPDPADLQKGLAKAQEACALDPTFLPAHFLAIELARTMEDQEKTVAFFRYALALFPNVPELRVGCVRYLMGKDDSGLDPVNILEKGMERTPESIPLRLAYAEVLAGEVSRIKEADSTLEGTVRLLDLPADYPNCIQAGFVLFTLPREGRSGIRPNVLVSLVVLSEKALREGMTAALMSGRAQDPVALFDEAFELPAPPPPALYVSRAWLALITGDFDGVESLMDTEAFKTALDNFDPPHTAQVLKGYLALGRRHPSEAAGIFVAVLEDQVTSRDALNGLRTLLIEFPGTLDPGLFHGYARQAYREIKDPQGKHIIAMLLYWFQGWSAEQGRTSPPTGDQTPDPGFSEK